MSGFVDETMNFVTSYQSEKNLMELCNMLEDSTQSWEHLLTISAVKLNPEKCGVYIVRWNFQED